MTYAKEIHVRLNESGKPFPLPIFVGWVESEDVRARREDWNHPDPGLQRFGDDIYSEIYGEAFRYANDSTSQTISGTEIGKRGRSMRRGLGKRLPTRSAETGSRRVSPSSPRAARLGR